VYPNYNLDDLGFLNYKFGLKRRFKSGYDGKQYLFKEREAVLKSKLLHTATKYEYRPIAK